MNDSTYSDDYESWLIKNHVRHELMTDAVVTTLRGLLDESSLEYLSIVGRTKSKDAIREKIKRKGYREPIKQLTDISGIRVILFIESDVARALRIVENAFEVSPQHSSNRDSILGADQVGYRSHHLVCSLGADRVKLPEFKKYDGLIFEIQVRTVLQHAWAELAHDTSYKFKSSLPTDIQRKLYLYAGLLEIADKGFNDVALEISSYLSELEKDLSSGKLTASINELSVRKYIEDWARSNQVSIEMYFDGVFPPMSDLLAELNRFGINSVQELKDIYPVGYAEELRGRDKPATIFGVVRDWMLIFDPKRLYEAGVDWLIDHDDTEDFATLARLSSRDNFNYILKHFVRDSDLEENEEFDWE